MTGRLTTIIHHIPEFFIGNFNSGGSVSQNAEPRTCKLPTFVSCVWVNVQH